MEKISETHSRKILVKTMKGEGLKEIKEKKKSLKERLNVLNLNNESDEETFDALTKEVVALNYLKDYLKGDTMFKIKSMSGDNVTFVIATKDLEVWNDLGVVNKYLSYLKTNGFDPEWLGDEFFGKGFITADEKAAYKKKTKK